MSLSRYRLQAAESLVAAAARLAAHGWCLATSGNLSLRLDGEHLAITVSGCDKARLTADDVLLLDFAGRVLGPSRGRPSDELPLHVGLYAGDGSVGAVVHLHTPAATAISLQRQNNGRVVLAGYEMLKALSGVTTHEHREVLPIFANDQDTDSLAERVAHWREGDPDGHAYLLAGHGLYTWGRDVAEAIRHVEALEFLLDCELRGTPR